MILHRRSAPVDYSQVRVRSVDRASKGARPAGSLGRSMRRERAWLTVMLATLALTCLLSACSTLGGVSPNLPITTFEEHRQQSLEQMRVSRHFQHEDRQAELLWNAPREWQPKGVASSTSKPDRGVLLVHGLGDSPWSFNDIAEELAAQGFLVRTVLLPGHGTQPANLIGVEAEQWQALVQAQVAALRRDVDQIWLGGFSTGANLVLESAYEDPQIAGLLLFSPGFKSFPFDWLAPLASHVRPWMVTPDGPRESQNAVRYMNVPTNGFSQFYRTSTRARSLLRDRTYDKPVFMVVAQHDSVLDTDYLLDTFHGRFTNPSSRLVWYGEPPPGSEDDLRILTRSDRLPALRISQFSHMGVMFSPTNPLYGAEGSLRICMNGQTEAQEHACATDTAVWWSDWGYREEGKNHARLTFNPYFRWQSSIMSEVTSSKDSAEQPPKEPEAAAHAIQRLDQSLNYTEISP